MTPKVAVIGCGGIGKRHLQSLLKFQPALDIFAVDSSPEALAETETLLSEFSTQMSYLTSLDELPSEITLAIVATSSAPRLAITEILLARASVEFLILEKVLFSEVDAYARAQEVIDRTDTKVWVNCPRRMTS